MPVINVEDLTDKDKALMEVNQLKNEVKLERWLVSLICEISGEFWIPVTETKAKERWTQKWPLLFYKCGHLDLFRRQNVVRKSRTTLWLEWMKTSLSKASQRIRTPSRRKVAVCSPRLDLRSFSDISQISSQGRPVPSRPVPSPHLTEFISRLRKVKAYNEELM